MSILRSSKFVRYFVTFARNLVISQPKNVDKALLEKSKNLISVFEDRRFAFAVGSNPDFSPIEKSLHRLDQDVRRVGRISRKELLEVIDEIRLSRQATSTQSLLIIRCCGSLVPDENPEVRTKLVNEVWETFEKIGVALDISHYNALLRVYLENEHNFSPTEFLSMLEKKGVEPNRVTFQRLILAYCQKGDIEGATRILEFMKEKQMPINDGVFNALIVGHSQADDMESAKGILGVMRQANLEPTGETYTALLCGHARRGDIDGINAVFNECNAKGVELLDKEILEVVFTLAINNNYQHIDEVLKHLRKVFGYNQDAKNVILRMIVRGEDNAAIKVLQTMVPTNSNEPTGTFIVRQFVKSDRPLERITSVCASLKESGENEYALHHAVETSLFSGKNPDLSLKLLSALAAQEPVCQHYYWPVLVKYGKANNLQGVYNTLKQLSKEVGQPVSSETVKDYVLPYMKQPDQSISYLRQAGVSTGVTASAIVASSLANNDMKEATRIGLKHRAMYNTVLIKRSLISAFLETKDVGSLVTMVQIMEDNDREDIVGSPGEFVLLEVVGSLRGQNRMQIIKDILQGYLENGIGLSNDAAESLQNSLSGDELTQEISTLLSKLTSPDITLKRIRRPTIPTKFGDKLRNEEQILEDIKTAESKGESVNVLKKELLTCYCKNKELEKAQNLISKLKEEGFEFSYGHLAIIMELYVNFEMLNEATDTYKLLCTEDPDKDLDEIKLIKYALLLAKNSKTEDAVNLFKKHSSKIDQEEREFTYTSFCWKLLNLFAETGDVALTKKLFNVMKDKKFIEPNNVLLGPLIKVHLINDDMTGALEQFEECCSLYRATPWKNEIACRLIQKEDATTLQRLTDLSTQIHGEMNSLYDLVLSFVECGRVRQARKILETPGLRARYQRINSACEKYTNEGKITHLENLVEATKDIAQIDRADIYYHLLMSYSKTDDVDKAMGLWTQMQDEDVQPTDQFLSVLGALLQKHNRSVPFAVPILKEPLTEDDKTTTIPTSRLSTLRALRRAAYGKDLDEVLELMNKLKDEDLSQFDRTKILNLSVNSGRLREASQLLVNWFEKGQSIHPNSVSNLLNTLAKLGDIDILESIGKYLDREMKRKVSFSNRRTHCMVQAGRAEDVLNNLLSDIKEAKTPQQINKLTEEFPRGGLFAILHNHPEYLPKMEEIAKEYNKHGISDPNNILWMYYFIKNDEAKAQEYWNLLNPSERLMFSPIINHARSNQNDELIITLLNQCKEASVSIPGLGIIYSSLMDIYISQGRENQCEKILEDSLKICSIEHLSRRTLLRLKTAFDLVGKEFKYTIPAAKKRQPASSSSSDSDDESLKKVNSL